MRASLRNAQTLHDIRYTLTGRAGLQLGGGLVRLNPWLRLWSCGSDRLGRLKRGCWGSRVGAAPSVTLTPTTSLLCAGERPEPKERVHVRNRRGQCHLIVYSLRLFSHLSSSTSFIDSLLSRFGCSDCG